jgi:GGDEF domain-containing protein
MTGPSARVVDPYADLVPPRARGGAPAQGSTAADPYADLVPPAGRRSAQAPVSDPYADLVPPTDAARASTGASDSVYVPYMGAVKRSVLESLAAPPPPMPLGATAQFMKERGAWGGATPADATADVPRAGDLSTMNGAKVLIPQGPTGPSPLGTAAGIVAAPFISANNALLRPVEGNTSGDPLGAVGRALGEAPIAHDEWRRAEMQTIANALAPRVAAGIGGRAGSAAAGALVGSAYDPRLQGTVLGALLGAGLHAGPSAEPAPPATPGVADGSAGVTSGVTSALSGRPNVTPVPRTTGVPLGWESYVEGGGSEGGLPGDHNYDITTATGETFPLRVSETDNGKTLEVNWIGKAGPGAQPNQLGPAAMMRVIRELAQEFPNAETIKGWRVSGARTASGGAAGAGEINLDRFRLGEGAGPEAATAASSASAPAGDLDLQRQLASTEATLAQERAGARTDALTGLPNRTAFREAQAANPGAHVSTFDLSGLKAAQDNSGAGHAFGDQLLRDASDHLTTIASDPSHAVIDGAVYRLGGDEFAALHPDAESAARYAADVTGAYGVLDHPGGGRTLLPGGTGTSLGEADRIAYRNKLLQKMQTGIVSRDPDEMLARAQLQRMFDLDERGVPNDPARPIPITYTDLRDAARGTARTTAVPTQPGTLANAPAGRAPIADAGRTIGSGEGIGPIATPAPGAEGVGPATGAIDDVVAPLARPAGDRGASAAAIGGASVRTPSADPYVDLVPGADRGADGGVLGGPGPLPPASVGEPSLAGGPSTEPADIGVDRGDERTGTAAVGGDAPGSPGPGTQAARDARGQLRRNLTRVSTDDLVAELHDMTEAAGTPSILGFVRQTDVGDVVRGNTLGQAVYAGRVAGIRRVSAELAGRGLSDADIMDRLTEMNAMRSPQVGDDSFDFVSRETDKDLEPTQYFSGLPITPKTERTIADLWSDFVHGPFEAVRRNAPEVAERAERALAAPAYASYLTNIEAPRVFAGEAPEAVTRWTQQKQLNRLRAIDAGQIEADPDVEQPLPDLFGRSPSASARRQANIDALNRALPANYGRSEEFQRINDRFNAVLMPALEDAARRSGVTLSDTPDGHFRLARAPEPPGGPTVGTRARTGQQTATASKTATGAGEYSPDPMDAIRLDVADKIPKAARNDFYDAVQRSPGAETLAAHQAVPDGLVARSFTRPGGQSFVRVAVTPEVARAFDHVESVLNDRGPTTPFGAFMQKAGGAFGQAALNLNPAATVGHTWSLSSVVGTTPEAGGPLDAIANSLIGAAPYGSTANGLRKIIQLDRTAPRMQSIERNLMQAGGMRPPLVEPSEPGLYRTFVNALGPVGKLFDGHRILFGENGVDPRTRLWLAQNYIQHAERAGQPYSWSQVARYVNDRAGSYIRGNAAWLADKLQSNGALFARFGMSRIANAARTTAGISDLPAATPARRAGNVAQTLTRGAIGAAIGLEGLNYLLAHHSTLANAPGHEADLQLAPDDTTGNPNTYLRGGLAFPTTATAMRSTGLGSAMRGDSRGAVRDVGNTALSLATSHPILRALMAVGGVRPTLEREGGLTAIGPHTLSGKKDLEARTLAALVASTHVGQEMQQSGTINPGLGVPGQVAGFFAPSITSSGNPSTGPVRNQRLDVDAMMNDAMSQIARARGDTAAQRAIVDATARELETQNMSSLYARGHLSQYMARVNAGSQGAMRRFQGQYGLTPPASSDIVLDSLRGAARARQGQP